MVSEGFSISSQVYEYLKRHPKAKLKGVQNVFNQFNPKTVKTAYYRWHKRRQKNSSVKRSDSVSKNSGTNTKKGKKGGRADKRILTPSKLTKIDENLLERFLLALVDFDNPDVKLAREMSSFIDRKKGFIQEEPVKIEFLGVDLDEQIELAEAYRNDIESKVSE